MTTSKNTRLYVHITALWGNDDAESTIKISQRHWKAIQAGAEYETSAWGWYEGRRFSTSWHFYDASLSVYAEDHECIIDCGMEDLIVYIGPNSAA
jgi:hypothetical protein